MMETKQKYFSPECEIVELRITQGVLTGSDPSTSNNEGIDWGGSYGD